MDFIKATAAPIIVDIDGKEFTFARLWLKDISVIVAEIRASDRKELISVLKQAKMSAKDQQKLIAEFQSNEHGFSDVLVSVHRPAGALRLLAASLHKGMPDITDDEIDGLPFAFDLSLVSFCYSILGHQFEVANDEAEGDDDSKNLPSPKSGEEEILTTGAGI